MATKQRSVRVEHDNDQYIQYRANRQGLNYSQSLNRIIEEARAKRKESSSE